MDNAKVKALLAQVQAGLDGLTAELFPVVAPTPAPVVTPTPAPVITPTPKPVGRVPDVVASTVAGLDYTYHEGSYSKLPDFTKEKAVATGTVAQPTLSIRKREEGWAARFTGYFLAPTDGEYTFYAASDDGSRLRIGTESVVDNDAVQGTVEKSGKITLQKGPHLLAVEYFNFGGPQNLAVSYAGPGIAKQVIPASAYARLAPAAPAVAKPAPASISNVTATLRNG